MRESADVLVNAAGGERVRIRRRTKDALEMTVELSVVGAGPPEHAHPRQEERFRVLRGALAVAVDGDVQVLRAGQELAVPPGARHRWRTLQAGTEVALTVRPALRFEAVLEQAFALVDRGAVEDPSALAAFAAQFAGEYELVAP